MKKLGAYKKEDLGYIMGPPAKDGDPYFKFEWRRINKFPFFKKLIITYMLTDEYWIEVLETDKSDTCYEIERRLRVK